MAPRGLNLVNGAQMPCSQPQPFHLTSHSVAADGRCRRRNPHNAVCPLHVVAHQSKGILWEKVLDLFASLVKHDAHGDETLQRRHTRLMQFHAEVLTL